MSHNWQHIYQQFADSGRITLDQLHPRACEVLCKEQNTAPWLIACSGGSDSVFLVLALAVLFPKKKKDFVIVHYNHKMRGKASDEDEQFVANLAQSLGLKYQVGTADFNEPQLSNELKSTYRSEEVLRHARMNFFKEALQYHQSKILILGHQMNDVLETMLMRLSRGSSLTGFIAPRPVHKHSYATFLRPLLSLSREAIQNMLKQVNVSWREDSSNQEEGYYRNRLRLEVIPRWLGALSDKQQERDLYVCASQTRDLLEEDEEALIYALDQIWPKLYDENQPKHLNTLPLKNLPKGLVRRALYRWLTAVDAADKVSAIFEKLMECCVQGQPNKFTIAPQTFLELTQDGMLQLLEEMIVAREEYHHVQPLDKPSTVICPGSMRIQIEVIKADNLLIEKILNKKIDNRHEAYLAADGLDIQLDKVIIRSWNPGDRYQPLGAPGTRKLQDLFIDRKIAHCKRHQLPVILISREQSIIWVPNLPPAESLKIFPTTKHLLKLTYQAT